MKAHSIPLSCVIEHKVFGVHSPTNECCPLLLRKRKKCEGCIGRSEVQVKLQKEMGESLIKGIEKGLKKGGVL